MSGKLNWQGSLDAFCGVYSAAHIIALASFDSGLSTNALKEQFRDRAIKAFADLLSSLEDAGLLKAAKIALHHRYCGYSDLQLENMINNLSVRKTEGLRAIAFRRSAMKNFDSLAKRKMIANGAFAIIQENGEDHWIAVNGIDSDGGYECYDPHPESDVSHRQRISWTKGLIIGDPSLWSA